MLVATVPGFSVGKGILIGTPTGPQPVGYCRSWSPRSFLADIVTLYPCIWRYHLLFLEYHYYFGQPPYRPAEILLHFGFLYFFMLYMMILQLWGFPTILYIVVLPTPAPVVLFPTFTMVTRTPTDSRYQRITVRCYNV